MYFRHIFLGILASLSSVSMLPAQVKLYEATFNGGVVTGGYSNGATVPSGSGSFNVSIPSGSTIRRAYLIAGRAGAAPDVTVTLNGTPFTFGIGNIITTGFTTIYGGNSAVHAIDITASISPATSAYTIAVPNQNTVSDKYPEFYLYIAFDNNSMPGVTSAIYCNTANLNVGTQNWTLGTVTPILTGNPVGLAILGGYATTGSDCENVNVNGTALGAFGGQDFNASSVWGCMAGFQYYNNALAGYGDDNADQAIAGTDVLSNIQAVIPNNTTSIPLTFTHCGGGGDNHVWAVFLTASGTVLDGKVTGFHAEPSDASVLLTWEMDNEDAVSGYTLERSLDGKDFQGIHTQAAQGATAAQRYTWRDMHPASGTNWYRLRMTDQEGLAHFSEVKTVEMRDQGLQVSVHPNPVRLGAPLLVQFGSAVQGQWQLYQLSDAKLLRQGQLLDSERFVLPTEGLSAGAYALHVRSADASKLIRFVVE